jgi:hypothetical protein
VAGCFFPLSSSRVFFAAGGAALVVDLQPPFAGWGWLLLFIGPCSVEVKKEDARRQVVPLSDRFSFDAGTKLGSTEGKKKDEYLH